MIKVRRGTTKEVVITLTDEHGNPYKIDDTDTLIFGVKTSVNQEKYTLSKTVDKTAYNAENGGYLVHLSPEDTEDLLFGDYVYDVGLQKQSGEFYPVCPCGVFKVSGMVTKKVRNEEN